MYQRSGRIVFLPFLLLLLVACQGSVTTQVVPIAYQLPPHERSTYQMVSDTGANLGQVGLSTDLTGSQLHLQIHIQAANGSVNDTVSVVDPRGLEPEQVNRSVSVSHQRYSVQSIYAGGKLTTTLRHGTIARTHHQTEPETAYDDQESLFLWRTLNFQPGYQVRYIDVVVNPETGGINSPVATAEVARKENVTTPFGSYEAWRVEFRAGGFVNTAWYEDGPQRRLVRYSIPAQHLSYFLEP